MKTITIYLALIIFSLTGQDIQAQDEKKEHWEHQKEMIISEEKENLKKSVIEINERLERKEITPEEATVLKNEAAEKHARNIKNRLSILKNRIALMERNSPDTSEEYEKDYEERTSSEIVIAVGFNNALQEGQPLEESDFKIGGSRFFEIGWASTTRVFKKSDWLRLRYGLSFQFNGLKPTDNRYFVEHEGSTVLEEFPEQLDKSKFRMDNLVFPLFLEIGPSVKSESAQSVTFSAEDKLKLGFGGYAGFNLGSRQKLKYEMEGEKMKEKLKNDYNTADFIYGLSAYLGWEGVGLYVKYDLNPIFEAPNPELHNFSVGLRSDID